MSSNGAGYSSIDSISDTELNGEVKISKRWLAGGVLLMLAVFGAAAVMPSRVTSKNPKSVQSVMGSPQDADFCEGQDGEVPCGDLDACQPTWDEWGCLSSGSYLAYGPSGVQCCDEIDVDVTNAEFCHGQDGEVDCADLGSCQQTGDEWGCVSSGSFVAFMSGNTICCKALALSLGPDYFCQGSQGEVPCDQVGPCEPLDDPHICIDESHKVAAFGSSKQFCCEPPALTEDDWCVSSSRGDFPCTELDQDTCVLLNPYDFDTEKDCYSKGGVVGIGRYSTFCCDNP